MQNLKKILSEKINTSPNIIQFAKDRKYEESWIIHLNKTIPTEIEIDDYLYRDKFETIIVEYIWNSTENDKRFVLTLFLDKTCKLQNPKIFVNVCLNAFYSQQSFEELINTLDLQVIGKKYLLTQQVDLINISVFNHWLSMKPIELWKKGEVYDHIIVRNRIQSRPEIEKTNLNYQGLLFRFNVDGKEDGPSYGFKTPCCHEKNGTWIVDYQKVDYWMKEMLQEIL